jgi:DNA-binding transcriptional ArsR family regulator
VLKVGVQMQKRLSNKLVYGPLSQKTLRSALKRELLTNFGFENMALVADLLIDRFLAIVDEFSVAPGRLQPYQTMVIGVDKREKFGYGTSISEVKLKPAIVSLITPQELLELAEGAPVRALQPRIAARIIEEAYAQGSVLTLSTIALLFGVSKTTVGTWIKRYKEDHPGEVLHYAGVVFDMGRAQTHKGAILTLYYQGLLTREISRRTSHDPHRVDKYIKDHQRVVAAHKADHSFDEICLLTGLSPGLVREHLDWYQRLANKEAELMESD